MALLVTYVDFFSVAVITSFNNHFFGHPLWVQYHTRVLKIKEWARHHLGLHRANAGIPSSSACGGCVRVTFEAVKNKTQHFSGFHIVTVHCGCSWWTESGWGALCAVMQIPRLLVGFVYLTCAFQDCPGHKYSTEKCGKRERTLHGSFSWPRTISGLHHFLRVPWIGLSHVPMASSKVGWRM